MKVIMLCILAFGIGTKTMNFHNEDNKVKSNEYEITKEKSKLDLVKENITDNKKEKEILESEIDKLIESNNKLKEESEELKSKLEELKSTSIQ